MSIHVAILISHPIQYQVPLYGELAKCPEIKLKVFFCSKKGLDEYKDPGFGKEFKWDIPLLDGYDYEFLENISPFPDSSGFCGLINPSIIKKLKKEKFDALWVHGWSGFTDWLAMLYAFKINVPVLLRGESNLLPKAAFPKSLAKRAVLESLFKKVSAFLAIGKYNSEFYQYYGAPKEKIFLVPYAVNNDFFIRQAKELISKKNSLKQKYNIPVSMPVILFSGKLIDQKRPFDLLKAYELLSRDLKASLIFVGDGKLRNELEGHVKQNNLENVYFAGFRNQTELGEFYAIADVFVLPSSFEPWGLVVNEAMSFGLPIIISDQVGAGGDLVKEGINGYFYPACDVSSLAAKLKMILTDKENMHKMGQASRDIISTWSYKEGLNGVLNCLRSIKLKH